jgi:uncharacterized protein (TIGR02231 family)
MKNTFYYSIALIVFMSMQLFAGGKVQNLESTIREVTVYIDRAQVTRSGEIQLPAGEHKIQFSGLPANIEEKSIQVNGKGNAILSDVRVRTEYLSSDSDAKMQALYMEEEKINDKIKVLESKIEQTTSELAFVENIAKRLTTTTDKGQPAELDPDKWIKMTTFYRDRLEVLNKEKHQTELAIRKEERQLEKVRNQIAALDYRQNLTEKFVEVLVENKSAGKITLDLSYIVFGPSWKPVYDVRIDTDNRKLSLTYNALVKQNTSEDWEDAKVKLSTALVNVSGNQPQLSPWRIYMADLSVLRDGAFDKRERLKKPRASMMNQMMSADRPEESEPLVAEEFREDIVYAETEVETKATAVEFIIAGRNTIKSDNEPHKLTVMIETLEAHFRYSTVPKLARFAYLKAKAKNTTGYPFLAGETNVFMDNQFVSSSSIDVIAPGEEFWTFLGVDEGVKVEYKFINKFNEDVGVFTKSRKSTFEYKIIITSNKPNKEEIVVWDQIPFSTDEQIKIELLKPEYKKDMPALKMNEHKYLEWYFEMESGEKIQIPLKFSVEYPKDQIIHGL